MIGKLKGRVDSTADDSLILDVNGVGYLVFCAGRTLAALEPGTAAELIIETHVREDAIMLFGFLSNAERDWFRTLGSVQGVGNKTALAILSAYPPEALSRSIIAKDIAAFKAISGIGPKLAERIVTELKDKVTKMPVSSELPAAKGNKSASVKALPNATDDAISALVNLGYNRTDAYAAALKAAESTSELNELIRLSLKELAKK